MKPPYKITTNILKLIASISQKLGEINAIYLSRPSPQLRKRNKIKTIHSSLKIEGNSLSEEQITAIVENKRVIGAKKDILEVTNAIKVYDNIESFNPFSYKSFLKAHKTLMNNLVEGPGKYRTQDVGIFKGTQISHLAPSAKKVPILMDNLFQYLKKYDEITLIKSCVFHYEVEFIHPFLDGNGRMGRLWQTVILMQEYAVFKNLPFETLINQTQEKYYNALEISDKNGDSTKFIEYMLNVLEKSLIDLLDFNNRTFSGNERLDYFISLGKKEFTRKDYMNVFKNISSSTASRDLAKGVERKILSKIGIMNKTVYKPTT
ncbi:adenosine monophosphate-protein transferase SoFic [bacterium BMS3Abin03]|nr:adenosine monophosphate-protein transferase SoFic [bacterium BMS3Abin03]